MSIRRFKKAKTPRSGACKESNGTMKYAKLLSLGEVFGCAQNVERKELCGEEHARLPRTVVCVGEP